MPSLKSFRTRIASVKSTQKITKAMQMVAAAKLRRAEEAAKAARPYALKIGHVVSNLAAGQSGGGPKLLAGTGADQVHLVVVMSSERGLCGGFNTYIARAARDKIRDLLALGKTVKIITLGKKGRDQLRRDFASLMIDHIDISHVKQMTSAVIAPLGEKLNAMFAAGEFDVAHLVYSEFKSVISQKPVIKQLIPVQASVSEGGSDAVYQSEPSEAVILDTLLPRYVSSLLFSALLENAAGEQGARMSAMDNATRNAGDMIKRLNLQYNRQRQANITKELIEIISGADAV